MPTNSNKHAEMNAEAAHRQELARLLYNVWSSSGSNESGLAEPLIDGRVDALGGFVTFQHDDDDGTSDEQPLLQVDQRHCDHLSYQEFYQEYMVPNTPVVIQGLTHDWRAAKEWVDESGQPDLLQLAALFGSDVAPVHVQSAAGFTEVRPHTEKWTINDYALWWYEHSNDDTEQADQLLYLKDYKFVAAHPSYEAYEWPVFFRDDWLNEYAGNAYKFVYLGPAGTSTRLHADVLRSYSWSTNVCGVKEWWLVPPQQTHLLYDIFGRHLASHLQCTNSLLYPGLGKVKALQVLQQPGETIFVPSGWHHTVENKAPTLSINHNWLNGTNLNWSWKRLKSELESLQRHSETPPEQGQSQEISDSPARADATNSQVGDELILLWLVVQKKARSILALTDSRSDLDRFDLKACLAVLQEMKISIGENNHGLHDQCHCDIDQLIEAIETSL